MYDKHTLPTERKSNKRRILIVIGSLMIATAIIAVIYYVNTLNRYHVNELVIADDVRTRFDMQPLNGYVYDDNGEWGKYVNGNPDGKIIKHNDYGNIIFDQNFDNGVPNGLRREWCSNGQLSHSSSYNEGRKNGLAQSWYCNGTVMDSVNYVNNAKEGIQKVWYENKILKSKVSYLNNKETERWEWNESADPIIIPYNETKVKLHLNDTLISKHPLEGFYKTSVYKLAIININEYDELLVVNIKDTKNQGDESKWFSVGEIKGWINPRVSTDNRLELRWVNADKTVSSKNARFYPQSRNLYVVLDDKNTTRTSDDINMILESEEI